MKRLGKVLSYCIVGVLLVVSLSACSSSTSSKDTPQSANSAPSSPQSSTPPVSSETAPAKTSDATPSATPVENTLEIGSTFVGRATVAWPSAPVTSSTDIQMMVSSPDIDTSKYPLILVIYGDPELKITPSTGEMHIRGTVFDFAKQEGTGLEYPVIYASSVEF